MKGTCRLCHEVTDLQHSHVIPRFAFEWLKKTSAVRIRSSSNINLRMQDGDKEHLLCKKCEQLFGGWEKLFADNIFWPLHSDQRPVYYPYQEWLLKFAVSVSWRVLLLSKERNQLSHLSSKNTHLAAQALEVWREFLLSSKPNPGQFEQHVLPMDLIESVHNTRVSPYLNRYLLRTIDDDICEFGIGELDTPAFVYSKIGRFAIIGLLHFPSSKNWKGTKLRVRHGKLGSSVYEVDAVVMQYINNRATRTGNSLTSMSRKQQTKVKQAIEANEDVYIQSEYAQAYAQDFLLSGEEAKTITAPKPSKSD